MLDLKSLQRVLQKPVAKIEHWLLPPRCVLTLQPSTKYDLSAPLIQQLKVPEQCCPQCCEPSKDATLCGSCISQPPAFSRTQVGYYFRDPLDKLIYDLKYHQQISRARLLVDLMINRIELDGVEVLVPVPIHPKRRRNRGYNQAELLANIFAKYFDLPVIRQGVQRIKDTPSQTSLSVKLRQQNLKQAFKVNTDVFDGFKKVALVDDVITTGATMQSLSLALQKQTQVQSIQAWAIAKTE